MVNLFDTRWSNINKTTGALTDIGNVPLLGGTTAEIAWQPAGNYLVKCPGTIADPIILHRTGVTSIVNSTTSPINWPSIISAAWASNDLFVAVGAVNLGIRAYSILRTGDTFAFVSSPFDVQPTATCRTVKITPDGNTCIIGQGFSGGVSMRTYSRSGNTWVQGSTYLVGTSGEADAVAIAPNGVDVAVRANTSNTLRTYTLSGTTLTQTNANIGSGTFTTDGALEYSLDGKYLYHMDANTASHHAVYDVAANYTAVTLGVTQRAAGQLSWSPNGNFHVTSGAGGYRCYGYNSSTGGLTLLQTYSSGAGNYGASYSPDEFGV